MNAKNAFDLTVSALREKGLSSDEILDTLGNLFKGMRNINGNKESKIKNLLLELGIPCNIDGYEYIIKAILLYDKDPKQSITGTLYPAVAEQFGVTIGAVERGIRYAIQVVWKSGNYKVLKGYVGNTIPKHKDKPTNSQFIAMCVEWINR